MENEIIAIVNQIKVNKRGNEYAAYKPLLLILILDQIKKGKPNTFHFNEIYVTLKMLMEKYGWLTITPKKAQYPFHFLASSILWETNIDKTKFKSPEAPTKKELSDGEGKLNNKVYSYLKEHPESIEKIQKFIEEKFLKSKIIEL